MKYIYMLIILSLSLMTAYSQDNEKHKREGTTILNVRELVESVLVYSSSAGNTKFSYTYDESGNMITLLVVNKQNDIWINTWRFFYTYDLNGNRITSLKEEWKNGNWINNAKASRVFDLNSNMLNYQDKQWNVDKWVNYTQNTYTYDSRNNLLTSQNERWQVDKWAKVSRVTYNSYNLQGNQLSDLHEIWQSGNWIYYWRATFTYDINGNRITQLYDNWINDNWVSTDRWAYTYDENGNMVIELVEYWKTDQWLADVRGTYTYNPTGQRTAELYESFQNGQWENIEHYNFSYNSNGNFLTGLCEEWNGNWNNSDNGTFKIKGSKLLPASYVGYKIELTYSGSTLVEEKNQTSSLSLNCSPNPASGSATISYALSESGNISFTVVNSLGIEAARISNNQIQVPGNYNINYDAGNLAPGVYFLTIKSGNISETKKMIVLR